MNIYRVTEDDIENVDTILKGETMKEVINYCEKVYVEERTTKGVTEHTKNDLKLFYHDYILQSCTLIGVLEN